MSAVRNKTIFTLVESEEKLETAIRIVEEITGNLEQPDTGILFTVPVGRVRGFNTRL